MRDLRSGGDFEPKLLAGRGGDAIARVKTARALLESALEGPEDDDPAAEACRQSRLASRHASEKEALAFIADASDLRGWE